MENKRGRLWFYRDEHVTEPVDAREDLQNSGDEVDEDDDRALPVVRGVNKRKRGPRGGGRRMKQKPDFVEVKSTGPGEENANGIAVDSKKEKHLNSKQGKIPVMVSVNVEEAVEGVEQGERRRESSRLRVRPSKYRESILPGFGKFKGDREIDDITSSLEIVLPMDFHNSGHGAVTVENTGASTSRMHERHLDVEKKAGKKAFKVAKPNVAAVGPSGGHSSSSPIIGDSESGLKAALTIVKKIMRIKDADPFNEPVDPVALEIPDYFDVIKRPMDLGTIRSMLEEGKKYKTAQDVYDDIQLVWSNCRAYNQDGDPIMDILKTVETSLNKYWMQAGLPRNIFRSKAGGSGKGKRNPGVLDELTQKKNHEDNMKKPKESVKSKSTKSVQFASTSLLKAKSQRSASVEQVMAECKAREEQGDTEDAKSEKEGAVKNMMGDGRLLGTARGGSKQRQTGTMIEGQEGTPTSVKKGREEMSKDPKRVTDQSGNSEAPRKEIGSHGSSNKRRTFGTVHHKVDCPCVVCAGRRRKLARQEKEKEMDEKLDESEERDKEQDNNEKLVGSGRHGNSQQSDINEKVTNLYQGTDNPSVVAIGGVEGKTTIQESNSPTEGVIEAAVEGFDHEACAAGTKGDNSEDKVRDQEATLIVSAFHEINQEKIIAGATRETHQETFAGATDEMDQQVIVTVSKGVQQERIAAILEQTQYEVKVAATEEETGEEKITAAAASKKTHRQILPAAHEGIHQENCTAANERHQDTVMVPTDETDQELMVISAKEMDQDMIAAAVEETDQGIAPGEKGTGQNLTAAAGPVDQEDIEKSDNQLGDAYEVADPVEYDKYYPANYELPLRKVHPELFRISKVLFERTSGSVWTGHHSLGYRPSLPSSKSPLMKAVAALTLHG